MDAGACAHLWREAEAEQEAEAVEIGERECVLYTLEACAHPQRAHLLERERVAREVRRAAARGRVVEAEAAAGHRVLPADSTAERLDGGHCARGGQSVTND